MSKKIDAILDLIDKVLPIEQHYECECGKVWVLRPNTSKVARVECGCGVRRDFNLA